MFTLSAILLEDCENLFQDFWTLFSISFTSFSASGFKKKVNRPTGPCPSRTLHPGLLKPARDGSDDDYEDEAGADIMESSTNQNFWNDHHMISRIPPCI